MSDHEQERWVQVYKAAVFELEQSLMAGRIAEARDEIVKRVEELRHVPGLHDAEQKAIEDALNNLRFLEREDVLITARRQKAEVALQRLRTLAPRIERPHRDG